jgi:hypothetical protein
MEGYWICHKWQAMESEKNGISDEESPVFSFKNHG